MASKNKGKQPAELSDAQWKDLLTEFKSEAERKQVARAPKNKSRAHSSGKRTSRKGYPPELNDADWQTFLESAHQHDPPPKPAPPKPIPPALTLPPPPPTKKADKAVIIPTNNKKSRRRSRSSLEIVATVDLHGHRRHSACELLEAQIRSVRRMGGGILLVIHGQGHNSGPRGPVLKNWLVQWAKHDAPGAPITLDPAKPEHGGFGASYLYL